MTGWGERLYRPQLGTVGSSVPFHSIFLVVYLIQAPENGNSPKRSGLAFKFHQVLQERFHVQS